jgi:DNA mismatch repair ATPase MutL
MNTKKIVAMTIALIMTTGMVAGCGNSVDHKDSVQDSEITTSIDKDVEKTTDKESKPAKAEDNKKSKSAEKSDATDKAEKKDSQAKKPNDNKAEANKSDKNKDSVQANNSSVSQPSTPAKPNKPNVGNSNSGSVSKPSEPSKPAEKPVAPQKPSEPETPAPHVCSFDIVVSTNAGNCQTASSTVKKCSCGKTTTVNGDFGSHNMVHHDAQGHEVTDYEKHYICNQCGADFGLDADAAGKHTIVTQGCQNYSLKPVQVTIPGETIEVGRKCSVCSKEERH